MNDCLQKERTDTARRLESDECDNGLQGGGVVVRAARERRVVSWTGCAGWRAAPSTLLSLASGRESFAARPSI
jgi:hypothetical protein